MAEVNKEKLDQQASDIDAPPFFKNWKGMYWFLVGFLIFQIIIYYLITIIY